MRAAIIRDRARFIRILFRNTANRMNVPRLRGNSANATQIKFLEKYVVHFGFKLRTRSTSIIIVIIAVNTRGVGFCNKLETILNALKNKFSVRVMQSSPSQAEKFKGQSSRGDELAKEASFGKESCLLIVYVGSHLSDFFARGSDASASFAFVGL